MIIINIVIFTLEVRPSVRMRLPHQTSLSVLLYPEGWRSLSFNSKKMEDFLSSLTLTWKVKALMVLFGSGSQPSLKKTPYVFYTNWAINSGRDHCPNLFVATPVNFTRIVTWQSKDLLSSRSRYINCLAKESNQSWVVNSLAAQISSCFQIISFEHLFLPVELLHVHPVLRVVGLLCKGDLSTLIIAILV